MVSTDWSSSFGYLSRMDENIILPKENYFRNTICPACLDLTYASIALNEPGINSDVKSPLHINRTNAIRLNEKDAIITKRLSKTGEATKHLQRQLYRKSRNGWQFLIIIIVREVMLIRPPWIVGLLDTLTGLT